MSWQGNRGPKPRPVLPREHELHPAIEACCHLENAAFKHLKYPGENVSNGTMQANHNGKMFTMIDVRAILAKKMQIGINPDHEHYPIVKRFDHRYPSIDHYVMWNVPVKWEHSDDFRYIPGYSRYVINFQGDVKNAYNGLHIEPMNGFSIELVPDSSKNEPKRANIMFLRQLAWSKLPEDFISYGFGNFSHEVSIDKENNKIDWVAKTGIVSKQGDNVEKWPNLSHFMQCCVENFQERTAIGDARWKGLQGSTLTVAGYMIKEEGEYVPPNTQNISVGNSETSTEASGDVSASGTDDFAF